MTASGEEVGPRSPAPPQASARPRPTTCAGLGLDVACRCPASPTDGEQARSRRDSTGRVPSGHRSTSSTSATIDAARERLEPGGLRRVGQQRRHRGARTGRAAPDRSSWRRQLEVNVIGQVAVDPGRSWPALRASNGTHRRSPARWPADIGLRRHGAVRRDRSTPSRRSPTRFAVRSAGSASGSRCWSRARSRRRSGARASTSCRGCASCSAQRGLELVRRPDRRPIAAEASHQDEIGIAPGASPRRTIGHALTSRRPKHRYVIGKDAQARRPGRRGTCRQDSSDRVVARQLGLTRRVTRRPCFAERQQVHHHARRPHRPRGRGRPRRRC